MKTAEHRIRLRGPWDRIVLDGDREVSSRLNLPLDQPPELDRPFRLERRFGRPPHDPEVQSISIEFLGVPGLIAARIDDRPLKLPEGFFVDCNVRLIWPLRPRNTLVLDVDPGLPGAAESKSGWGTIALVIASQSADSR